MAQTRAANGPVDLQVILEDDSKMVNIVLTFTSHYDAILLHDAWQQCLIKGQDVSFSFSNKGRK